MSIQYHDPRAALPAAAVPYALHAEMSAPITIGLLANGFPDSVEFLAAVEVALKLALPAAQFRHYNKGNPSIPATPALLATISGECQAVASAYGH